MSLPRSPPDGGAGRVHGPPILSRPAVFTANQPEIPTFGLPPGMDADRIRPLDAALTKSDDSAGGQTEFLQGSVEYGVVWGRQAG